MVETAFESTPYVRATFEHLVSHVVTAVRLLTSAVLDHQIKLGTYPEDMVKAIPLERWGTAGEIAEGVVFLASEKASFITGEELYIDGGSVFKCAG